MRDGVSSSVGVDRRSGRARERAAIVGLVMTALWANPAMAVVYKIAPLNLGSGYTLSGAIATDGTQGVLTAANITNWNLRVTSITDIVYTPGNTSYVGAGAFLSGGQLMVPTSPDGSTDGGSIAFRGGNRFQVQVADFTGANVSGGQAFYVDGAAFDFLPLHRPNGVNYLAATESAPGSLVYNIVAKRFSATTVMSGTLSVSQTSGAALFTDWNILVRETQNWNFNPGNSDVLSDLGLSALGTELIVTPFDVDFNPGSFIIGNFAGGDLNGVILGDFTYDPGGVAGYQSPFGASLLSPVPLNGQGNFLVGTAASVPEPASWAMLVIGFGLVGAAHRRRREHVA